MGLGPPPRVRVMGPLHFREEPQGSRSGSHFLHTWQRRVVTCAPTLFLLRGLGLLPRCPRAASGGGWPVYTGGPATPPLACLLLLLCVVLLVTPAAPPPVVVPVGHRTLHLSYGLEGS